MYYYIVDENFSKGLTLYFSQYHWNNKVFEDFINKMIEAAWDKYSNLQDL